MKIGPPSDISPAVAQSGAASPAKAGEATPSAAKSDRKSPGVGVTVSAQARTMEQTRADATSEVDMDKVNAVRQAIAQKTFSVNAEAIADKLLTSAREMLDRTRS